MNEKQVLALIRREIQANESRNRFTTTKVPYHTHNGTDSLPIQANNVVPSASITGSITMSAVQQYTLQLNASFTPRSILAYGIVIGAGGGSSTAWRIITIGSAQLTPTFYLQDPTTNQVDNYAVTGDLQFPFNGKPAQSSVFHSTQRGSNTTFYAGNSEDHIVSVFNGLSDADIQARVTVTGFSKTAITLDVPILQSGFEVTLNFVIT